MSRYLWLIISGLIVGGLIGYLYATRLSPVEYTDTLPSALSDTYKADYLKAVAFAYVVEQDIDRARQRLTAAGETNPSQTITALAQRTAAAGGDQRTIRALAELAVALGARPAAATATNLAPPIDTATPEPPTPIVLPSATPVQLPTPLPTPSVGRDFIVAGQQIVCDPQLKQPVVQVISLNAQNEQIPGLEVLVDWNGGSDRFFTGLKPELGIGYGDFAMTAGESYALKLVADPSVVVVGLTVPTCSDDTDTPYVGSWQVVFKSSR